MSIRKTAARHLPSTGFGSRLAGSLGVLVTLIAAVIVTLIILLLLAEKPSEAVRAFLLGPFQTVYNLGNLLNTAGNLMLTGLGIVLAFRASVFNLGGEGQVYAGALAATIVGLALPSLGGFSGKLLTLTAAGVTGALIAGLSGFFRMKWGTNELISSYLLSAATILIVDHLITGPLDDPNSNLLSTPPVSEGYHLTRLLSPSHLNTALVLALLCAVGAYLFLFRSRRGYELRMCGLNPEFARYGGIRTPIYLLVPMLLSGGLLGLTGGASILGTYHRCIRGFSAGMGWNGIAVALIGRTHPLGVIPAALFYAYLDAGAKAATLYSNVPYEVAVIIQSVIFYLITAQGLYAFLSRRTGRTP